MPLVRPKRVESTSMVAAGLVLGVNFQFTFIGKTSFNFLGGKTIINSLRRAITFYLSSLLVRGVGLF